MGNLTRWTTAFAWLLLAAALVACATFAWRWHSVRSINAMIGARTIETLKPLPDDSRVRYAAAWDHERAQHYDEAIRYYTDAQAAADPALASHAWLALGNAFFEQGIRASRQTETGEAAAENAQFDLARDAYRSALRIDPWLHDARYNLELLERLAPTRSREGWRRNTDPITIQPNRHNGWTTIQESPKRGLP
ncbi:MAG TPA: tetratricopeptide repeat protein [Rhodanobacteraceae bacterium]|nr:tetratricopeptide repeat protein [Rhodanobacteraceae bacterium]